MVIARSRITPARAVAVIYTVGMFMSIMDTQIVNVALATLSADFAATPAQVQWVVTGYLLSLAICIPASGWLGDRFGTKRVYLLAVAVFTAASGLCAVSVNLPELVIMRILQGAGGGLMIPVGSTMLYRAFPPARRVQVARTITRVAALAPATAPIIGGVLVTSLSWRWIFVINLPTGIAAFCFGAFFLVRDESSKHEPFDLPGFVLAGGGLAALLYSLSEGASSGWTETMTWASGLVGVAALTAYARLSRRREHPLLRLTLLREPMFRRSCAMIACSTIAFFASLVFTALYLQEGRGASALMSGLTTFPEAIGIAFTSQLVARLYPRVGPRRLICGGFIGLALVNGLLATAGARTDLWLIRALMLGIGITVSFVTLPTQASAYAQISSADTGHASAIFTSVQRSGGAIGIAALSTILAIGTGGQLQAPAHAFHAVYLAAGAVALVGALYALRIRDSDVANTMGGADEQLVDVSTS